MKQQQQSDNMRTTWWSPRHDGLNQEKYLKSCLGLGPIFFESTTPEVFKTNFREIADFRPGETLDQS